MRPTFSRTAGRKLNGIGPHDLEREALVEYDDLVSRPHGARDLRDPRARLIAENAFRLDHDHVRRCECGAGDRCHGRETDEGGDRGATVHQCHPWATTILTMCSPHSAHAHSRTPSR